MDDYQNDLQSATDMKTINSSLHMYTFFQDPNWVCAHKVLPHCFS